MRHHLITWFLSFAVVLAVAPARLNAAPIDTRMLVADDCPDASNYYGTARVVCGRLPVREGENGTGRQIELSVVLVIPHYETAANREPTIYVHGGPGAGITSTWAAWASEPYAINAPFILFDQRSTGRSSPKLCPAIDGSDAATSDELKEAEREIAACLAEVAKAPADLNAYGTDATVRDMEEIRKALRIERWNVLGISYGTTVTLAYLAAHPEHTRAAVLDSVYPPEAGGMTGVVPALAGALRKLQMLCNAQPRCHRRFGDMHTQIEGVFGELSAKPFNLTDGPDDKKRIITASTFFSILQISMMDTANWYLVPTLVEDVRNRRETTLVSSLYDAVVVDAEDVGVWFATECRERAPFDHPRAGNVPDWPALTRAGMPEFWLTACAKWPAKLASNWQTPRNASVPTLVIGGGLDPITPAADAQATAKRLGPKAQLMIVPNASHSALSSFACVKGAITAFLDAPAFDHSRACNGSVGPPEFATQIVTFDLRSSIRQFFSRMGASQPAVWSLAVWYGLIVAALWPFNLGGHETRIPPIWQRASIWLSLSVLSLVLWSLGRSVAAESTDPHAAYWATYGIPAHAWPGFSLIVPAMAMGTAGAVATFAEARRGTLELFHFVRHLLVVAALTIAFAAVLNAGALPASIDQVTEDIRMLRAMTGL